LRWASGAASCACTSCDVNAKARTTPATTRLRLVLITETRYGARASEVLSDGLKNAERNYTGLMKFAVPVLMFAAAVSLSAQEKKVPKDSLRVSIPGCSRGSAFVVTASPEPDRTSNEIAIGRRFRLTGPRDVLNEIKKREGTMVEVTGIIKKNDLKGPGGISLGGGRVRIGGVPQDPTSGVPSPASTSGNAIIDVEGFRPLAETCPS